MGQGLGRIKGFVSVAGQGVPVLLSVGDANRRMINE